MDGDKIAIVTLLFLFLGGSFLAALLAVDPSAVPVALVVYLLVAVLLLSRIRRATSIWDE
jgi:membrane protein implicated in regulation of membrane protease activity